MELWDLYTRDREKTGKTMVRGEATPKGCYRMAIHICIFGEDGRMLIQQRQPFKESWPNLWDFTVGGHSVAGETSQMTAERELKEELGIALSLADIRPVLTMNFKDGFDDYYLVERNVNLEELTLQQEEVQAVRWAGLDEILSMIDDGTFIPYHKSLVELLFAQRKRRGGHSTNNGK